MTHKKHDIAGMREHYTLGTLLESDIDPDPVTQFSVWFNDAVEAGIKEPNVMILSTVSQKNTPASRVVLLKDIRPEGFTFFTNYQSQKGNEIAQNAHVSLLFPWTELQRQVRIDGVAEKLSHKESELYFNSRPVESRIGASISPQSSEIPDRSFLENAYNELLHKHSEGDIIHMPEHWGGYLIRPKMIEFWQGRPSRLHDRIVYTLKHANHWQIKRLAP